MGSGLAERYAEARAAFDEADAALGEPLSRLCFEGPEADLQLTANTQPAILAASVAALRALLSRTAVRPTFVAGHSLGEYSALVAAGAIDFADAVRVTRLRGRLMQEAVAPGAGAMAAVMGLDPEAVAAVCSEAARGETVSPANFNAPGQIVIAGTAAAVGRAVALVGARGGKAVPLKVSAPFHCALMEPCARGLRQALSSITVRPLRVPVVTNVEATPNADAARVVDLLVRQVDGAVRWEESVRAMIAAGVRWFVEIGPGKVLAGLVKRIDKTVVIDNVSDPDGVERVAAAMGASA